MVELTAPGQVADVRSKPIRSIAVPFIGLFILMGDGCLRGFFETRVRKSGSLGGHTSFAILRNDGKQAQRSPITRDEFAG